MALTLFHVDWCPDCHVVRQKLSDLRMSYQDVIVPDSRRMRAQVYDVSGQYYVPVLKDGDLVLTETEDILEYLDKRYGTDNVGGAAATPFESQARATPDMLDEDDDHPSCRIN
ncbi:MAG: glutathione S-transferase N-terminal domain-containing protein [Nitrospira sp.]|nr:glutathione S-transferase N-terminal domain-containing protein [Nitrospira sp.]MDH4369017.1 glutathione S-transferase N-terminal domain-containing protein [Nitrospira sp.]MDH5348985.1 glutathione S-transferase N-terminal domain-containing protein [Nitrospira sp.]MDH5496617.1 glutathione S-transferase N-terminal domain-containing protein [Nitrospira sp.]MDH5726922.1 glutathione S-transferase N-terminal domain-containing protein [Nitrospira sp.]